MGRTPPSGFKGMPAAEREALYWVLKAQSTAEKTVNEEPPVRFGPPRAQTEPQPTSRRPRRIPAEERQRRLASRQTSGNGNPEVRLESKHDSTFQKRIVLQTCPPPAPQPCPPGPSGLSPSPSSPPPPSGAPPPCPPPQPCAQPSGAPPPQPCAQPSGAPPPCPPPPSGAPPPSQPCPEPSRPAPIFPPRQSIFSSPSPFPTWPSQPSPWAQVHAFGSHGPGCDEDMDWESTPSPCSSMDYEASVSNQTDVLMYCQTLQCVSSGIFIVSLLILWFLQLIGWDWPPQSLSTSPFFY